MLLLIDRTIVKRNEFALMRGRGKFANRFRPLVYITLSLKSLWQVIFPAVVNSIQLKTACTYFFIRTTKFWVEASSS